MGLLQPSVPPTPKGTSLHGKTAIVVGGNSGLGLETARQYLVLGASRVIIACRSKKKGAEAVVKLRTDVEVHKINPKATVEAWDLDLDDYKSAIAFCSKVKTELDELDILLCNGGTMLLDYQQSKSGHERVMQVNCYSHFLISLELLPLLRSTAARRSAPTHLAFTGSFSHLSHALAKNPPSPSGTVLGHFDSREKYQPYSRYNDSKLVVRAFVAELASRTTAAGTGEVVVNDVCPGFVRTGFDLTLPWWLVPVMVAWRWLMARDVGAGARVIVYASAVAGAESHGRFVSNNESSPGSLWLEESAGREFRDRLWNEIVEDTSEYDPELKSFATATLVSP